MNVLLCLCSFFSTICSVHYCDYIFNLGYLLRDIFVETLFHPPPDEVGTGGIGIASDVCPSCVRMSGAELGNPYVDFFNF